VESLKGPRIVLREYVSTDATAIHKWWNDLQTTLWMGARFRRPSTLKERADGLERIISQPPEDSVYFAIADKTTSAYIGGIDLTSIDYIDKRGVLSIVIGDLANRNKGYGGEAIGLLLEHAFRTMKLHKVELNVSAKNEQALKCYLKAGFQIEGRKRDHYFVDGEYSDENQMGILESEFRRDT
jgi:RimJ/RimL family protein N-acetyltransferase